VLGKLRIGLDDSVNTFLVLTAKYTEAKKLQARIRIVPVPGAGEACGAYSEALLRSLDHEVDRDGRRGRVLRVSGLVGLNGACSRRKRLRNRPRNGAC